MASNDPRLRPTKKDYKRTPSRIKAWVRKPHKSTAPVVIPIIEVFAAFVAIDRKVDPAEAEVTLDFLRHSFPEADHHWLAHRLEKALKSPKQPSALAPKIKKRLDAEHYPQLALQLYILIHASSQTDRSIDVFLNFFEQLGNQELGKLVVREFDEGYSGSKKLPFTRLIFSTSKNADIILPAINDNYAFRLYQSGDVIIIRNTGGQALWLSGVNLPPGHSVRMRSHQRIILPHWTLSYTDLNFFLNFKQTQQPRAIFLHEADNGLIAERARTRQSTLRIDFGTTAILHAIRPTNIKTLGAPLKEGANQELQLHDSITLGSGAVVTLEDIRHKAIVAGGRFKMSPGKQTCVVSNDPLAIGKGDLLISPNLAGKITLKISYNPSSSIGEVEIIESERTLLLNNQPLRSGAPIADGALIRLSASQAIRCRFSEGIIDEERTVIQELHLDGITHRFNKDTTALDSINFKVMRGEMLCIMGPSGCGKSTLLATIAGHLSPDKGHVRFNGISLYQHRSRLAPFITFMPQEEALNPNLTVREHLLHSSAIRRPHLDSQEHERRTDSIIEELALGPLANRRVGSAGDKTISGGERGRLNLGLDLGSAAEIFLFDEPISGLSSKDSEHVTESLRALARDKIVIASLHRPGASVLSLFDKVLLLDKGGKVAYFGAPSNMTGYFERASQELNIPNHKRHDQIGNQNADFVFDVLEAPLLSTLGTNDASSFSRRFPPSFWQERHENHRLIQKVVIGNEQVQTQLGDMPRADDNMPVPEPRPRRLKDHGVLFLTHLKRSALAKIRNRGTFYATALEAPLLSLLIAHTLRASAEGSYEFSTGLHIVTYLFLAVTVAMFLGLTNSATEILRDMPTLRRERNTRYGTGLYIAAKFVTLSILAAVQCAIFITLGHFMLEIKEMWLSHWMWTTLTAMTGTAIALLISTIVKNERAALSSIPLLLVPQLLLAGALVPFGEMNRGLFIGADDARNDGAEPVPAMFMPLRYSFEGIILSQATQNPFERERRNIQEQIEKLKAKVIPAIDDSSNDMSDDEAARIKILTAGLTRLYAAETTNQDDAASLAHDIARASLYGSMQDLESINIYQGDEESTEPVQSFFQNTRAELLVRRAEMHRVDMYAEENRSIFLAEWKFWFGQKRSSIFWCQLILVCFSVASILLATGIMTRWNRRTR